MHLAPSQVPPALAKAVGYSGRTFQFKVRDHEDIGSQCWSEGSRTTYYLADLETLRVKPIADPRPWPQSMYELGRMDILPGFAIIRHVIFCGKDLGLRFTIHPDNAPALLPPPIDLTADEAIALDLACGIKAAYRADEAHRKGLTPDAYAAAKASLIAKGLLDKRGAATIEGRNARPSRY